MLQSRRAQLSCSVDTILITSGPADLRNAERVHQLCFVALSTECTLQHIMPSTANKRRCTDLEVRVMVLSLGWICSELDSWLSGTLYYLFRF